MSDRARDGIERAVGRTSTEITSHAAASTDWMTSVATSTAPAPGSAPNLCRDAMCGAAVLAIGLKQTTYRIAVPLSAKASCCASVRSESTATFFESDNPSGPKRMHASFPLDIAPFNARDTTTPSRPRTASTPSVNACRITCSEVPMAKAIRSTNTHCCNSRSCDIVFVRSATKKQKDRKLFVMIRLTYEHASAPCRREKDC